MGFEHSLPQFPPYSRDDKRGPLRGVWIKQDEGTMPTSLEALHKCYLLSFLQGSLTFTARVVSKKWKLALLSGLLRMVRRPRVIPRLLVPKFRLSIVP